MPTSWDVQSDTPSSRWRKRLSQPKGEAGLLPPQVTHPVPPQPAEACIPTGLKTGSFCAFPHSTHGAMNTFQPVFAVRAALWSLGGACPLPYCLRRCDLSPDYKRAKFKEGGQVAREDVAVLDTGRPPPSSEGRRQLVARDFPGGLARPFPAPIHQQGSVTSHDTLLGRGSMGGVNV